MLFPLSSIEQDALIMSLAISPVLFLDESPDEEKYFKFLADTAAFKIDSGNFDFNQDEIWMIYNSAIGVLDILSGTTQTPLSSDILGDLRRFFFVYNGIVPRLRTRFPFLSD